AAGRVGALRAAPLQSRSHGRRPVGLLPDLLLCRRVPRRLHVDGVLVVRQARQQPALPPPRAGDAPARKTRTPGAGRARARRSLRQRTIRDHRGGCDMSNFVPCPSCNRHVLSAETACPFCTAALPESLRLQTPAPRPPGRLSRAALLAAGAALMGAEACSAPTPVYGAPSGFGG